MNIKAENNNLTFTNGKTVEFPFEVSKYICWENDTIIVLLKYPLKEVYNRNVFGFDINGNKLWQIENLANQEKCPYVDVIERENKLLAFNWCDFRLILNPLTGEILEKNYTK